MHGPLEFKSPIDQRHEGALQEAQTRRLAKQAQRNTMLRPRWASASLSWASAMSLLRGTGLS